MMKFNKIGPVHAINKAALVCICTVAIYGCSGSSSSTEGETGSDSTLVNDNGNAVASDDASNTTDMGEASGSADANEESESTEPDDSPVIAQPTPVTTEPSSPATTRVDFNINVPTYMSNELQVQLTWGDINTTAAWVQDETWAVTETFPAATENLLVVTFADRNGAITLGSFESTFKTGTDPSETFQINVDQFNTERWDNDNDGVSNLDELIAGVNPEGDDIPQPVQAAIELVPDKTFRITWQTTPNASHYRVLENSDGVSGFSDISGQLDASTGSFNHRIALYSRVNAQYIVQSCNDQGCADSAAATVTGTLDNAIGYIKASNTGEDDFFSGMSLSADGITLAVGASGESSIANGIDGDQSDNSAERSGAVYVFKQSSGIWQQQAYVKASNTGEGDRFGAVRLSADGTTLAVGASRESSAATGINGDQNNNSVDGAGAVYLY